MGVPPEEQKTLLKKYGDKVRKLYEEQHDELIKFSRSIYEEKYTEDEIKEITSSYKSPTGQKLQKNAAEFTKKLSEKLLKGASEMYKKMNQITDEMMQELKMRKKPESPYNADASFSAAIIGCWAGNEKEGIVSMSWVTCYYQDGNAEAIAELKIGEHKIPISIKETWKIINGKLVSTLTDINPADMADMSPIGSITTDQIVSISTDKMILISDDGDETIRDRVKELKIPAAKHDTPDEGMN